MKQKLKEILYISLLSFFIIYSIIMMINMSNVYEQKMIALIVITVLLTYFLAFALRNIRIDSLEEHLYKRLEAFVLPLLRCSFIVSYALTIITIFYFSPYLIYYLPTISSNRNVFLFLFNFIDIILTCLFLLTILICFIVYIYISYIKKDNPYRLDNHLIIKQYNDIYHYKPHKYLNKGYFYRYSTPE